MPGWSCVLSPTMRTATRCSASPCSPRPSQARRSSSTPETTGSRYRLRATSPPSSGGGTTGGSPGIAVGEPAPDAYQPPKEEPVYKLESGGRWYINLQAIGDHLVWDLSYNPGPNTTTRSYNPGETFVDNYAYGMINARTGEIIRLRRPMKITLPVGPTYPKPEPRPMPVDDAPKPEVM